MLYNIQTHYKNIVKSFIGFISIFIHTQREGGAVEKDKMTNGLLKAGISLEKFLLKTLKVLPRFMTR